MALFGKPRIRDATTLCIESTDVRFLTTKGAHVQRWGSAPLPPGLVAEGLVADSEELGHLLDQLFSANNLDRKRVITALSGLRSIPRLLTMPKLQVSLLEEAIAREARKEMPLSLDDLHLSWQRLPGVNEDQQRVYLLGVPRDMMDAQLSALSIARIAPFVMDLKPLALIRAIGQEEAIIACLEQDIMDLILVVDGLPAIMRSFALEEENLSDRGKLDRLINELTQTVRFYNDSHPKAQIKPATSVYITGRALGTREASEYFKSAIDRPVERAHSPLPAPGDLPVMHYMANLGLAMKKV